MMVPQFAPTWAEVFGEDRFGIFAEFTLKQTRFIWRWIMPGQFLMGSNSVYSDRFYFGPEHSVTISRGFWLGETAVTQQRTTVMGGNNPSSYKGEQRPVETVNSRESMAFADTLSEAVSGLNASLPTEAQWEYACRAGTQ